MNLSFNIKLSDKYNNFSQKARVLTEDWVLKKGSGAFSVLKNQKNKFMSESLFDDKDGDENDGEVDGEIKDLMETRGLEKDEAEHIKEIMDETGLNEDEAVELKDVL